MEPCQPHVFPTLRPSLQVCRDCGGGAPVDAHFCPQCTKILSLGRHGDYFAFLGLPRKLQSRSGASSSSGSATLSRQFHPDYFYNAHAGRAAREPRALVVPERRVSHAQAADRARRVPAASSRGSRRRRPSRSGRSKVPPALLEEVFALNEELDEIRELRACGAPADDVAGAARARARRRSRRSATTHEAAARGAVARAGTRCVDARRGRAPNGAPVLERAARARCSSATTSTTCSAGHRTGAGRSLIRSRA